ncbi:hypothetical protein ES703_52567 [subsurface metagenome]
MKSQCGYALYWHNCYKDSYDLIMPESMAHPAKMAPTVGFRILQHLEELGLLNNGDTILDPMAGTGLTNICAGAKGYKSISVELEAPFIEFQEQNKKYAERRLFKPLDWQILKGDSRELSLLLSEKGLVSVTSPPYGETVNAGKGGIDWEKAGRLDRLPENEPAPSVQGTREWRYSDDKGNIGNLPDRPLKAITSPPYGEIANAKKNTGSNLTKEERLALHGKRTGEVTEGMRYSHDKSNIGNLPDKPLISIMSPPYGDVEKRDRSIEPSNERERKLSFHRGDHNISAGYQAATANNIGNFPDETYLAAMLKVYQEIAEVSDILAVIIKNPTRNKQLRRLDLDTIRILELAGWNIHCQHRALLFEELEQATLFGETTKMVKGRMSFFKRLAWQNGQPVASWANQMWTFVKYEFVEYWRIRTGLNDSTNAVSSEGRRNRG